MTTWMLYGAYGYTGRLVAALACERGEFPVLGGRDEQKLETLGRMFELEHKTFDLADESQVIKALEDVDAVAHCAGPFSATAKPMIDACIATGTNYLDITGEISVFEHVLGRDEEARSAGVALLPGAGFDVVPSDCLAAMLAEKLPTASSLTLAIRMPGGPSPGTAKTMVESLNSPALARVGGTISPVPSDRRRRKVPFRSGEREAVAIAWGDVSTAFHSTGIGDVTVYAAVPRAFAPAAGLVGVVGAATRVTHFAPLLKRMAARLPGPSARTRSESRGEVWGEAVAPDGARVSGSLETLNGYDLTADSVVRIAARLAAGRIEPGAWTPSRALGSGFVRELDNVTVHGVSPAVSG